MNGRPPLADQADSARLGRCVTVTTAWWKSYVIYLVIVAPFVALSMWLIHARWLIGVVTGVIIFAGLTVKDRIQRRIWP